MLKSSAFLLLLLSSSVFSTKTTPTSSSSSKTGCSVLSVFQLVTTLQEFQSDLEQQPPEEIPSGELDVFKLRFTYLETNCLSTLLDKKEKGKFCYQIASEMKILFKMLIFSSSPSLYTIQRLISDLQTLRFNCIPSGFAERYAATLA